MEPPAGFGGRETPKWEVARVPSDPASETGRTGQRYAVERKHSTCIKMRGTNEAYHCLSSHNPL
jgi:hypothetical protein